MYLYAPSLDTDSEGGLLLDNAWSIAEVFPLLLILYHSLIRNSVLPPRSVSSVPANGVYFHAMNHGVKDMHTHVTVEKLLGA
jgi:hypothetical protein